MDRFLPYSYYSSALNCCIKTQSFFSIQEYRVPLVDSPLEISVDVAAPEPQRVCQTIAMEITETVCNDVNEQKCIDLAKVVDSKTTVDQVI